MKFLKYSVFLLLMFGCVQELDVVPGGKDCIHGTWLLETLDQKLVTWPIADPTDTTEQIDRRYLEDESPRKIRYTFDTVTSWASKESWLTGETDTIIDINFMTIGEADSTLFFDANYKYSCSTDSLYLTTLSSQSATSETYLIYFMLRL